MTIAPRAILRRLSGYAVAGSIVLGSVLATATPAAALGDTERDVLRALAATAAIGLVVKEVNDNKKKKAAREAEEARRYYGRNYDWDDKNQYRNKDQRRNWDHKRDARRVIPAECVQQLRLGNRMREVVPARCAERSVDARYLPAHCAFDLRGDRGARRAYGLNCLRENGIRVSRR